MDGARICFRCGTFVAAELFFARANVLIAHFIQEHAASFPRRIQAHHFLWACAFVPIFIVPPIVSLVVSIAGMRRGDVGPLHVSFDWIAVTSAINVILSAIFLYKMHFSPVEIIAQLAHFLQAYIQAIVHKAVDPSLLNVRIR